jgi:dihydrofolate synthase/folylpolyglutamate synthase
MNYNETIEYLFTRLPMFSRIGAAAYKKDLSNTLAICQALGNPQMKFRSVHIAGTNGKGSTSHMIASILQESGYRTGLYTSPHLIDFRERIKINGAWIIEDFVVDFVQRTMSLIESLEPSFFEITVAMAFEYFARAAVDIAIVEVGLGGRLDSTNIINPEISVITNIGYDHMNLLGNELSQIAHEKAGIIKKHVPVIVGEWQQETYAVFEEKAREMEAPLKFADQVRKVTDWKYNHHELVAEISSLHSDRKDTYKLDLAAIYQTKNLVTTLAACQELESQGWKIPDEKIKKGLGKVKKSTGLHGRWEVIHQRPLVVLDVGHNEAGIREIVRQIEVTDHEELHIIIGLVKDKEIEKILSLLPVHASFYFTRAQIPRALPEDQLMQIGKAKGLNGKAYPNVSTALQAAMMHARPKDLILVCGSVFVVGEVSLQEIRI